MGLLRHIPALAAVALVAACTTPSIRTAGDASALNVVSVSVETAGMDVAVTGRQSAVTKEQLDADLTAAVTAELAQGSDATGTPAEVTVVVQSVKLAPPAARIVAATSTISGTVSVTEQKTGRVIVPPTAVTGNSKSLRAVGVIGLATTQTVENDYRGTIAGFAATVRKALFGPEQ
jgi:hypothetical protein